MAPSFFAKKRASFITFRDRKASSDTSTDATASNGFTTSPASSTGATTPPSLPEGLSVSSSVSNLESMTNSIPPPPPMRPTMSSTSSKRQSVQSVPGMSGLGSPLQKPSPLAPRITSIVEGAWVYQKVLSVYGTIGDPQERSFDGTITISRLDDGFPPICWPVCDSHFKGLVYLMPGPNKLRFDFTSPKLANSNSPNPVHSSYLTLHMVPPLSSPPLHLAILLGSDSPGTFDAVPARIEREGNGLETAIRKFRMTGYLWQAYTAEQMYRNKLGRRVFRMEEEWVQGTSNLRDRETGTMRSEAKIHVIRTTKTVAELRNLDITQQNADAKNKGELYTIATEAVKEYFKPAPGQTQYVSVLLLDAHWDKAAQTITGHAALGGGGNGIQLGIFGSQALQSYPSSFEEVVPAFTDCTKTDTNHVANDCNESGSNWEAANIGIGAHLHETGHLFGCPHQENGIMLRDYVTFNRAFTTREPYSTRTKSKGGLVLQKDECTWHRLDCLRFKTHPCFAIPTDMVRSGDESVEVWPVENGNVIVTAGSGVAYAEIFLEGEGECHHWHEFGDGNGNGPIQRQVTLTELDLRSRLPVDKQRAKMKLNIKSWSGGNSTIDDFSLLASKASRLKLPNGQQAFRCSKLGQSAMEGSTPDEVVFDSAIHKTKLMVQVRFYHGFALDGIEFFYEDSTSQLFGKRGGQPGGSEFNLDTRRGEYITGFIVRSGFWIDGIAIMTSLGRVSQIYGNPNGGSGHKLLVPLGYRIAGVTGSCAAWVDGFGVILIR
ncbi:zinc metallo protein-like proteinase [Calycina marina]|uniref:Zinc metallo protein-like proteinase n=1 Tax=Calycina marina TaxID=1763456 RepID=A0A9P8CJR4_9HELO|nr:zinc metallo protein-like proteinase [Calycina marina]